MDLGASANWSLGFFRIPIFIDPVKVAVLCTVKFIRLRAIVPKVFEIEDLVASWVLTLLGLDGSHNQGLNLMISCQGDRSITSGIDLININSSRKEALKYVDVTGGGSLMDSSVAILILDKWAHSNFQKKPNDLNEAFVTCPVQWGVPASFFGIRDFAKWIRFRFLDLTGICISAKIFIDCRSLDVFAMSVVLK